MNKTDKHSFHASGVFFNVLLLNETLSSPACSRAHMWVKVEASQGVRCVVKVGRSIVDGGEGEGTAASPGTPTKTRSL